jgi:hypothetical protein
MTGTPSPVFSADSNLKNLQQLLAKLQQSEKEIQDLVTKLNEELTKVDKMLPPQAEEWTKHLEEYFNKLVTELKTAGIDLTEEEKAKLRDDSATFSNIKARLEALKKLQIEPSYKSDFAIATYDVIVAALSRALQKVDDKSVKVIIKESKGLIVDEESVSNKIKTARRKQYKEIIDATEQLKAKIAAIVLLSTDELHRIEQQIEAAAKRQFAKERADAAALKA